jgi:phosphomannomutase
MNNFDSSIFRAYDIRGIYPSQINKEVAYAAGQAFVKVKGAKKVVVGRDVRPSGIELQQAAIQGILDAGAEVIEIGVISTEMLYFAAATLQCDGGMSLTASHNPAEWNGIKFIAEKAIPLTKDGDLGKIYQEMQNGEPSVVENPGSISHLDLLPEYKYFLRQHFVPKLLPERPLKIVANTNFGADGRIIDSVFEDLPLTWHKLNWPADGTFPKGAPDPMLPKNRQEISQMVIAKKADFGAAWDADADRVFFYDEKGRFFHAYYITALLIKHFLEIAKGATVVVEPRLIWANQAAAAENGGVLVFSRTGHGFIKAAMRANQAIFGGESSGHYYYRDFFYCDNGLVSFFTVWEIFAKTIKEGGKVSELLDYYLQNYPISLEEMNYLTTRADEIATAAKAKYADGVLTEIDGISIEYPEWRFNLRMSSNEPVLRLNVEARNQAELELRKKELMELIEGFGAQLRNDD